MVALSVNPQSKRHGLTLIEVLVALTVIISISSLLIARGAKFMSEFEFRQEKSSLCQLAERLWQLSKLNNQVLTVKLSENNHKLKIECSQLRYRVFFKCFTIKTSAEILEVFPGESFSLKLLKTSDLNCKSTVSVDEGGKCVFTNN